MSDTRIKELTLLEKAALQSGENTWQTRSVDRLGIRSLFLSDGPHGIRKQAGEGDHLGINASLPATCFPTAVTMANSWDLGLAERVGSALGEEASALGVDVILGPGLNIKRSPLGGRSFEYFSEDPYLSGKLAARYVMGIQGEGVGACPKHYAANNQETNRMTNNSVVDAQTLRQLYLTAFEIVVRESDPLMLMTSYNLVNGTYANQNAELLSDILRGEWGFGGTVVTDWGGGDDAALAAEVGGGFEMPSPGFDSVPGLIDAAERGVLSEGDLDQRVAEFVSVVDRIPKSAADGKFDVAGHNALAREAASRGAVLLRNEDQTLPLAPGTRVAVVGDFAETPRYQGAGSSLVNPTTCPSALDAILNTDLFLVGYAQGFHRDGKADAALVDDAVQLSEVADVTLLYMGLDELSEYEGADRTHLSIPANQVALLEELAAAGRKIVVVFSAGSATTMPWLDHCDALVHGFLGGQAGAPAMFDLLTGAVNPSGRLAETFPLALKDTSTAGDYPAMGKNAEYREAQFIGYRYAETVGQPSLFPFGFGLSYTDFDYSDPQADGEGVEVTIKNIGGVAGKETVQVYVGRVPGSPTGVIRPARVLAGFAQVDLEPGESKKVRVPFDGYTFRHYNAKSKAWEVESGDFVTYVGPNVRDAQEAGVVRVGESSEVGPNIVSASVLEDLPIVKPNPDLLLGLEPYVTGEVKMASHGQWLKLLDNDAAILPEPSGPLTVNSPVSQMAHAPSFLARFASRRLAGMLRSSEKKGKPDLNLLFLNSMPFRAMYKMSGGMVDQAMVQDILKIVNGHFFKGLGALIPAFFKNRKAQKEMVRAFNETAGNEDPAAK